MATAPEVAAALGAAAQDHQRRLVALLAAGTRDIAAAEDAVAEAYARAASAWREGGIPANPAGWLLAVARNHWRDAMRHARVAADGAAHWLDGRGDQRAATDAEPGALGDARLQLLFVCAHPALNRAMHAPLMLQVVLGVPVERMAALFLMSPAALGQRLSRAKARIRDAGMAFEVPDAEHLPARLPAVLDAIYGAYSLDWTSEGAVAHDGLGGEAVYLARLLAAQLPEPEVLGLLALLLWCESRRAAREGAGGQFVPLEQQDVALWDSQLMAQAAALLARASTARQPGRYQLEAALQSVHARRADTGSTDWPTLAALYRGLLAQSPTLGYELGYINVLARTHGVAAAWGRLSALPHEAVRAHQPYWVLRAHLLALQGATADAVQAYTVALGMTGSAAVRNYLAQRLAALRSDGAIAC